jgi:hypothetical protein
MRISVIALIPLLAACTQSFGPSAPPPPPQCSEEVIWELGEGDVLTYRGSVARGYTGGVTEYSQVLAPGDEDYADILDMALRYDQDFRENRRLRRTFDYVCSQGRDQGY